MKSSGKQRVSSGQDITGRCWHYRSAEIAHKIEKNKGVVASRLQLAAAPSWLRIRRTTGVSSAICLVMPGLS
jgi:hypothetical protein